MGYVPHDVGASYRRTLHAVKTNSTKKSPTLGEFIARIYEVCGKRKAQGIVRFALQSHLVEFRDQRR